jgi:hypothetical protein
VIRLTTALATRTFLSTLSFADHLHCSEYPPIFKRPWLFRSRRAAFGSYLPVPRLPASLDILFQNPSLYLGICSSFWYSRCGDAQPHCVAGPTIERLLRIRIPHLLKSLALAQHLHAISPRGRLPGIARWEKSWINIVKSGEPCAKIGGDSALCVSLSRPESRRAW